MQNVLRYAPMIDPQNVDFHEIARRGDTEVMEMFLKAGLDSELRDSGGHTLIMIAAYNDQPAMVELLLGHGADPNRPGGQGTPLMGAVFKGHLSVAKALLGGGADPDLANAAGGTALHFAVMFGQEEMVHLLLEKGADPGVEDAEGRTPGAMARSQGQDELARRLEAGGHP